jgi:hypothetical protein
MLPHPAPRSPPARGEVGDMPILTERQEKKPKAHGWGWMLLLAPPLLLVALVAGTFFRAATFSVGGAYYLVGGMVENRWVWPPSYSDDQLMGYRVQVLRVGYVAYGVRREP